MNKSFSSQRGITLVELLIALTIFAITAGIGIYSFRDTIWGAKDATASQLQADLTNIYNNKVNVGLRHDNAASVTLTKNLLDVLTIPPTSGAGANITGTGWVNEQLVTSVSGRSMSASVGTYALSKPYVVNGTDVVYDKNYTITFTPTSTSSGTWVVAAIAMPE